MKYKWDQYRLWDQLSHSYQSEGPDWYMFSTSLVHIHVSIILHVQGNQSQKCELSKRPTKLDSDHNYLLAQFGNSPVRYIIID